ncbi:hypothetical protein [Constantimarinum furrinae]|uniref:YtxH domain-containing protein n=1 Tax=Constantimarinum furrinae TaxID=2562285 RepID=A0A7G8PU67_9FLAO|nr:hypothetical protein [Constantimarinum furrinae]QNJ97883.1 hypothetical protein ALE3EI_1319 [Constantimarinum furrinae]
MKKIFIIFAAICMVFAFYSCRETTGEKAEEAIEAAAEDTENNLKKAGEAIEEAAEETGEALEKAGEEIQEEIDGTDEMTGEDDA